jgi:hypothetical protein
MRKILLFCLIALLALPTFAQNAAMVAVASQRFENGEMIYRHDNGEIYVISNSSGQWWRFPSSQYGRLSENRQTAPSNRISPANGFGRIWANNETIRRELGWAANVEIGFEMRFTSVSSGNLYLTRLNGIILELSNNGRWRTVTSIPIREGASISRFTLSSQSIAKGGTISINWEATGADFVQLAMTDTANPVGSATVFDSMPLSGSLDWTIPETIQGDVVVTLWLINLVPSTSPSCCYDHLSSLSRPLDVFQDTCFRIDTQAAYQRFEEGFMIWRKDNGEVRVFYDDGTWLVIQESTYATLANNPYVLPESCTFGASMVNAFWAVWSGMVQWEIGCPVNNEYGYTLRIQAQSNGDFSYCLPSGDEIRLNGQAWHY